jgi:hypothetical protein
MVTGFAEQELEMVGNVPGPCVVMKSAPSLVGLGSPSGDVHATNSVRHREPFEYRHRVCYTVA